MAPADLRDRIADQFSDRGARADVWRAFDLLLDADAYLNLGYSARFQTHLVGSPQRRLASRVGRALATHLPATDGVRLLDVGCGRGGPSVHLADRFGFHVTGVDLVPYNVARARQTAAGRPGDASFVVGDATCLPFGPDSVRACAAVDSLVYLPDRAAVFEQLVDVLEPGGVLALTDLVVDPGAADARRDAVARFADAWDMPPLGTRAEYERGLADAGLTVRTRTDLTPHSVGRFRTWTTLYRWLDATPLGGAFDRLLARRDVDAAAVREQVDRAHDALPALRHVLLVAERRPTPPSTTG